MKNKYYVFTFVILIIVMGCDQYDGKLTLVNNSNDTIYYSLSFDNNSISSFPINQKEGKDNYEEANVILPKSEIHETTMDTWEEFINTRFKDSTLLVFFFTDQLIKVAGRDSIMRNQLYSKKVTLKVKDLEKLNWRVIYQ